jgi:serine protease Do
MRTLRVAVVVLVAMVLVAGVADARTWSWLGVRIRDLSEQEMEEIASRHGIREGFGVVIVDVMEGTPAATAGVRSGDVVVAFNDRPVTETRMLQRLIGAAPTDADVRLTVLRSEGRRALPVRLVAMPRSLAGERVAAEFGFALQESETGTNRVPVSPAALPIVSVVVRGSVAERAGLEAGDVIVQVGEQPIVGRDAARDALAEVVPERPLHLGVRRGERLVSLDVPPP